MCVHTYIISTIIKMKSTCTVCTKNGRTALVKVTFHGRINREFIAPLKLTKTLK